MPVRNILILGAAAVAVTVAATQFGVELGLIGEVFDFLRKQ